MQPFRPSVELCVSRSYNVHTLLHRFENKWMNGSGTDLGTSIWLQQKRKATSKNCRCYIFTSHYSHCWVIIATVVCNICISISIGLRQLLGLGDYKVVEVKEWRELEQTAGTNTNRRRQLHGCIQATVFLIRSYRAMGILKFQAFETYHMFAN